jgi:hypothetical protein
MGTVTEPVLTLVAQGRKRTMLGDHVFEHGPGMISVVTVDLPPGVTKTLDLTLLTGPLPQGTGPITPRLLTTPAVTPWATAVTPGRACGK